MRIAPSMQHQPVVHDLCKRKALPVYVSIRQHTSAYVIRSLAICNTSLLVHDLCKRKALPAYVSIRQHTSAYVIRSLGICNTSLLVNDLCKKKKGPAVWLCLWSSLSKRSPNECERIKRPCDTPRAAPVYVSIRQHTSAYVSIRQHTSACVSIRQRE